MSNFEELIQQRALLDQQITALVEQEKNQAIMTIRTLIEKFDLRSTDLFSQKLRAPRINVVRSTKKVPAKYRNPLTGDTWTGRGKSPTWLLGQDRTAFLITN